MVVDTRRRRVAHEACLNLGADRARCTEGLVLLAGAAVGLDGPRMRMNADAMARSMR